MKAIRVLSWLVVAAALAACHGPAEQAAPASVLQRGIPADPETLDPQKARTIQAADVLRDIGEGLVGYSATGGLQPAAAEGWEVSEDGLTYTFHLRAGLRWSNGDALTAAHFVAGLRRLVAPETGAFYAEMLVDLVGARAIVAGDAAPETLGAAAADERTLVLSLERPTPYLLSLLTHPSTFPVHPPSLAEHGETFARPGRFVSNGAYVLDAWVPGSTVALRRNTEYWNDAATAIDAVNYHVIVQSTAELNRFRAGDLHITSTVPPDSFAQVRDEYGAQLRLAPVLGVYYYGFNLSKPPFKGNRELRQALSMAIDREELTRVIMGRGEAPAYSWVPPGVHNYEPPVFSFAALDKAEREAVAKRLFQEAGYGPDRPLQIELRYNTLDANRKIALAVQAMWREVLGVETTLVNEEFKVLLANIRAAEITQVFRSGWRGDYNDAHTFLSVLQGGSATNLPQYANEEYDGLMQRAAAQVDPDRRRLYLEEAERVMLADHAAVPLYFYVSKHLVSPRVTGWGDNVLDYHYSQHLSLSAPE